jgi:hypothetical protein
MGYVEGPWWVEPAEGGGDGYEVHDGYGHTATVWGEPDVALANARLIAAAPDLLAELRALIPWSDKPVQGWGIYQRAAELIAHIEGVDSKEANHGKDRRVDR